MDKVKRGLRIIIGLIKIIFMPIILIYQQAKRGGFWLTILSQPIIISIYAVLSVNWWDNTISICTGSLEDILRIAIAVAIFIAYVIGINAIKELIYYFKQNENGFKNSIELQRVFYNYFLIIISLIALFLAMFPNNNYNYLMLLIIGVICFLSLLITDLYFFTIHKEGLVKELYEQIKRV